MNWPALAAKICDGAEDVRVLASAWADTMAFSPSVPVNLKSIHALFTPCLACAVSYLKLPKHVALIQSVLAVLAKHTVGTIRCCRSQKARVE